MDALTFEQITAAQNNDIAATSAVIEATEGRVTKLADIAARRMGGRLEDYREEFAQVGRIAVWEALSRFTGDTVDSFFAFMYSTVENVLMDAVRSERNGAAGADADAVKVFASMLELANGDVYLAEKLAQTVPPKGRRLGRDRANAARLAWQGAESIDVPSPTQKNNDRGYSPTTGGNNALTLAESLAGTIGVPEDLITSADVTAEERRRKCAVIQAVIDTMGDYQAHVIRASFGIDPVGFYGRGDNDDELAADMGLEVKQVQDARKKGLRSFGKRYIKVVAKDAEHADELTAAMAEELNRKN
jgi:RNA polymerase sigma factor (sigma-70 family)